VLDASSTVTQIVSVLAAAGVTFALRMHAGHTSSPTVWWLSCPGAYDTGQQLSRVQHPVCTDGKLKPYDVQCFYSGPSQLSSTTGSSTTAAADSEPAPEPDEGFTIMDALITLCILACCLMCIGTGLYQGKSPLH
jgi:hypothetical protein